MDTTVLITGGAGFIGSHVADELLQAGYRVRALDNLSPQVHGADADRPDYLHPDVELLRGDVCDPEAVQRALQGVDAVLHLAAAVGVGQSMYCIRRYVRTNDVGTAVLLEALAERPVERLVVASSMSVYGEGLYRSPDGRLREDVQRDPADVEAGRWEPTGPDGRPLEPVPTPESKRPTLASVYALSKYDQECLCLTVGRAYEIDVVALRLFNVYGPRQALSNPYTGVMAIFASRLLNDRPPLIFEDGRQQRDFVNVHDVARAWRLALESPRAPGQVLNIGSGTPVSIRQVADRMAVALNRQDIEPQVTGSCRAGDIRHCFADISRARQVLGYEPQVDMEAGMRELAGWLEGRVAADNVDRAQSELAERGLVV